MMMPRPGLSRLGGSPSAENIGVPAAMGGTRPQPFTGMPYNDLPPWLMTDSPRFVFGGENPNLNQTMTDSPRFVFGGENPNLNQLTLGNPTGSWASHLPTPNQRARDRANPNARFMRPGGVRKGRRGEGRGRNRRKGGMKNMAPDRGMNTGGNGQSNDIYTFLDMFNRLGGGGR